MFLFDGVLVKFVFGCAVGTCLVFGFKHRASFFCFFVVLGRVARLKSLKGSDWGGLGLCAMSSEVWPYVCPSMTISKQMPYT